MCDIQSAPRTLSLISCSLLPVPTNAKNAPANEEEEDFFSFFFPRLSFFFIRRARESPVYLALD